MLPSFFSDVSHPVSVHSLRVCILIPSFVVSCLPCLLPFAFAFAFAFALDSSLALRLAARCWMIVGKRAADMTKQMWTGRMRVVQRGLEAAIMLVDR